MSKTFTIVGAGLVGSFLAVVLARRGHRVKVFDGLPDSRSTDIYKGRSINLALSSRGWKALQSLGLDDEIRKHAIPMSQRVMHDEHGVLSYQPYGKAGEAIYSVSRAGMNQQLMTLAEKEEGVTLHFEHRLEEVDFDSTTASFSQPDGDRVSVSSDYLFGADGANSKVRRLLQEKPRVSHSLEYMPVSYIELNIPPDAQGQHQLEPLEALHIWPRGDFMLIALPNTDGSFTCTLFLNDEGEVSFAAYTTEEQVRGFFAQYFGDVLGLLDDPIVNFMQRTPSPLALVDVYPWTMNNTCLIGDACHAIVPFYGQGMNACFEDCRILDELIGEHEDDWPEILHAFQEQRKPDAEAIATLSKMNFVEMSELTGKPDFLLRKKIEGRFSELYPELWSPLYSMVTFSPDTRYSEALARGRQQDKIMDRVMAMPDIETRWERPEIYQIIHDALIDEGLAQVQHLGTAAQAQQA